MSGCDWAFVISIVSATVSTAALLVAISEIHLSRKGHKQQSDKLGGVGRDVLALLKEMKSARALRDKDQIAKSEEKQIKIVEKILTAVYNIESLESPERHRRST